MEHFEGPSGAFAVIGSEKLCLGDEGFGFEPDLISPTDEVWEVDVEGEILMTGVLVCLLYTSPSPRDQRGSRMPSSA